MFFDRPYGVAVGPRGTRAYAANEASDTVSVIDTDPKSLTFNQVIATVSVGDAPKGVAVAPDGMRVYVANSAGASVSVIDTDPSSPTFHQVIATVPVADSDPSVGDFPHGVAVHPKEPRVYVTNSRDGTLLVIDTDPNSPTFHQVTDRVAVGITPIGVAVHPDGSRVYVANSDSGNVSVIDTAVPSKLKDEGVGSRPFGVAVTPDGSKVYVTNESSNNVSVINTAGDVALPNPVMVGKQPKGVAIHPDGSRAYVANHTDNSVSVINTATNTVIDTDVGDPTVLDIKVGKLPIALGQFITGPVDKDGDGIVDLVDGFIDVNGNFVDESDVPSKNFTNQHLCGTTFGSIDFVPSGMAVKVISPAGLGIGAFGGDGTQQATVNACGFDLLYDPNDVTVINSCGSLTAQVLAGPVEILLGTDIVVAVPSGATVRVAEIAEGQFEIQHLGGTGTIIVEFQDQTTELGPGSSGTFPPPDSDGDGVPDDQDNCPDTSAGDVVNVDGCSIAQLCPCSGPASGGSWKNHGEYVSCVTQAAEDLVDAGQITGEEKGAIVSEAAQSNCGKKK